MTDDKSLPPTPEASPKTAKKKQSAPRKVFLFAAIFVFLAAVLAANIWLVMHGHNRPAAATATANMADASQKFAALERKMETLAARVTDLSARVDDIAAAAASSPAADTSRASKNSAADLARVQGDLAALASTVSGLQTEAASVRGESIAFVQLREAAISGRGFAHELEALQATAKNDAVLKDLAGKLAPFAEKGAPAEADLREQLAAQITVADNAIAKAGAQSWWERIVAALKGLVLIRPLHGAASPNAALDAMQEALARDDLGAALDGIKNLPPEAQKTLDDWRQKAEARQTVDEALRALADHLIAGPGATPPAQGTP
jgi:hypothetical protein